MSSLQNSKGFTLIELLVVVAIIALLVGIMVPAVQNAMDIARNGVVRTQFHAIGVGLEMFKQDSAAGRGQYPDSIMYEGETYEVPGYVSLAVYLLGKDLRGYCPTDDYEDANAARRDPYIKLETTDVVNDIDGDATDYNDTDPVLLCKWGQPILYFRADPGSNARDDIRDVYESDDNLLDVASLDTSSFTGCLDHSGDTLVNNTSDYDVFYGKITNTSITVAAVPYNLDSFILWSAGKDGEYGTDDDVKNFGN